MTATPLAPNDKRQYHRVRVQPVDAQPFLTQKILPAFGPGLEIRIPGNVITAQVPWVDGQAKLVDQVLGLDGTQRDDFVNIPIKNQEYVEAIAFTAAASAWAPYLPRMEGAQVSTLAPKVTIAGLVTSLEHRIEQDGKAHTVVGAAAPASFIDPLSRLPDSVRQVARRMIVARF